MKSVAIFLLGLFLSFGALANGSDGESKKENDKITEKKLELAQAAAEKEAMLQIISMGVPDDFHAVSPAIPLVQQQNGIQHLADQQALKDVQLPAKAPSYGVGITIPLKK